MGWKDAPLVDGPKWASAPVVEAEETESKAVKAAKTAAMSAVTLNPATLSLRAGVKANELLEKGAYAAGGAVTDITGSPAAGTLANAAVQAVPMLLGGPIGKAAAPAMEAVATRLMTSAVKPSTKDLASGKAAKAVQTMLEDGINATEGGKKILQSRITALETEVEQILNASTGRINPESVAVKSLRESFEKVKYNLDSEVDAATVSQSVGKLLEHPLVTGQSDVPVAIANRIKQAIYKGLNDTAYGIHAKNTVEQIAEKALGRNLKEGIGAAEPRVLPSLAEQRELLNALKVMSPRADAVARNDVLGIGGLSPSVKNAIIFIADRSPWFKSNLARIMYSGSEAIPANAARMGLGVASVPDLSSP